MLAWNTSTTNSNNECRATSTADHWPNITDEQLMKLMKYLVVCVRIVRACNNYSQSISLRNINESIAKLYFLLQRFSDFSNMRTSFNFFRGPTKLSMIFVLLLFLKKRFHVHKKLHYVLIYINLILRKICWVYTL